MLLPRQELFIYMYGDMVTSVFAAQVAVLKFAW